MSKTKTIILILVAVTVLVFGLLQATVSGLAKQNDRAENVQSEASLNIIAGEKNVNVSVPPGSTLYDALVVAQKENQISFAGKTYPILGFFVTSIGGLKEGHDKYLIYYINGKESQVGVSTYKPLDGDKVVWKLE
jgi:hypothetical protein